MVKPIEFKAGTLTAMTAVLHEIDNVRLADALQVMLSGMGEFFAGEATIIDVSSIQGLPQRVDWVGLQSLLRRYGLQPVALKGAPDYLHDAARRAGFAILEGASGGLRQVELPPLKTEVAPPPAPAVTVAPAPEPQKTASAMVVERTIRSGQQIYARGCDLIVLGGVSHGAEVIADGNIHCYGPLRGRVLAGAAGDQTARIITTNFGPELISIAGVYRTFEQGIPPAIAGHASHALLRKTGESQSLVLEPLQLD
ncbi:septum site-determining protein MinC [Uliginosibacterium gangwonense]|uniref:septum site-determining protein MinC n=1 Tax=Uliginosibacterium gangwonense TaxID=392736 RepID=UPI00037EEFFC|nr:septum site-determining protein MinC [Uliginosibacterium gangwonense]